MNPIQILIGKKVTVYSRAGEVERSDVGVLEATDGTWIQVRKAEGDALFFSIANVRMIKPFEPL